MRRIGIAGVWVAAAIVLTAGCNREPNTIDVSSGAPRQVRPVSELVAGVAWIADLPVPVGFKLDQGKSRNYSAGGFRFVDHTYKGRADKLAVKRFYERQMPINRWTLTMSMFVRGEIRLDFEKETERCLIIIGDGSLFHPVRIQVQMYTSGQVATPGQK